jgi:hypothetical protein
VIKILYGVLAGLLSALIDLALAYVAGVIVIAITTREFLATMLSATTVLPLMLLFVLLVPTIVIGLVVGLAIALTAKVSSRTFLGGATAGMLSGVALLSLMLPLIVKPEPGDFTSIVSNPVLSATYGLILGLLASGIYRYGSSRN